MVLPGEVSVIVKSPLGMLLTVSSKVACSTRRFVPLKVKLRVIVLAGKPGTSMGVVSLVVRV